MRLRLGILTPFVLEAGLIFVYSSIRYRTLETSLVTVILTFIFPVIIIYVLSPHIVAFITGLYNRIEGKISEELNRYILAPYYATEQGRTQMLAKMVADPSKVQGISEAVKKALVTPLTLKSYTFYKDNYNSRSNETRQEKSFEYFESLILFSSILLVFFSLDLIMVWVASFGDVQLLFITIDVIESPIIMLILSTIFIVGIGASALLLLYAINRFDALLPYSIPILFTEPEDELYLRRETIRSLVTYNFDNLMDRVHQKRHKNIIESVVANELKELLQEEVRITARKEFAQKLAWREYINLLNIGISSSQGETTSRLEDLSLGQKIGPVTLDEKDLLGIHSDLNYINARLEEWSKIPAETKIFVYFQIYRVVEAVLREVSLSLDLHEEDDEFNLYDGLTKFENEGYINKEEKSVLNNLRFRRNKLMHEPGISLDVSRDGIEDVINVLETILEKIANEEARK